MRRDLVRRPPSRTPPEILLRYEQRGEGGREGEGEEKKESEGKERGKVFAVAETAVGVKR